MRPPAWCPARFRRNIARGSRSLNDERECTWRARRARPSRGSPGINEGRRGFMDSFVPTAGTVVRQWHVIDAEGRVARAHRDRGRASAAGEAQGDLHAAHRHRRPRRGRQRRQGQADRPEGRAEALSVPQRLRGRPARGARQGRPAEEPGAHRRGGGRGMLPKTKLGEAMWRKLKVYAEPPTRTRRR